MTRLFRFAFVALLIAAAHPSFAADAPTAGPVTFSWSSLPSAAGIEPPPPPPPVPVSPRSGFEGVLYAGPGTDVSVAAGENAIMIASHGRIAITGPGGSNRSEVNARDFFGFTNGTITGTQCFYDPVVRVWWVVGHWSPPGDLPRTLMIAHSTSPSPRGSWGLTSWETATIVSRRTTAYGAEPIAAMAPGRFVVALRHFVVATGLQDYESVLVFDRTVLDGNYGYAPPVELRITTPPAGGDRWDLTSTRPAACLDATADEVLLVTSRADGGSRVTLRRITGPPSAPALSAPEVVNVAPYSPAPGARQRGTLRRLQTGDCRVRSAIVRDGVLSAAWHEAGRSGGHTASGIRVLQVRLRDRAVLADVAYGASRTFAWAPALTSDALGTLHLGYVRSSADEYPSVWTATRRPGAAKFEDAVLARAGAATSDSLDWSGPSAATIDASPSTPGLSAWIAAPYSRTAGVRGVWVQPLRAGYGVIEGAVLTNCGSDAPSPADRLPASGRTVTLMRGGRTIATALTDAQGTFAFDGLEGGTYDVIASIPPGGAAVEAIAGGPATETVTGANSVRVTLEAGQGSTGTQFVLADPRPLPQVTSVTPAFAWAGAAACTLTVNGSDFVPCTSVRFGSLVRDARYVSSTQLRVVLGAADLVNPGPRSVRAYNPEPGGGFSASVLFDVRTPDTQAPTVTLLAPVGGENWWAGGTYPIRWDAVDDRGVESVDLAWSSDGGVTFPHVLARAIPNSGRFDWTLPDTGVTALRVRVTARDAFGNIGRDSSRAAFALPTWTVTVTSAGPGRVEPSGVLRVVDGAVPRFVFTPDSARRVSYLRVNGVLVTASPAYQFAPVHANQTLFVQFSPVTYAWTPPSDPGNFAVPTNWTPPRETPMPDDILVFGDTHVTTVTDVPTQGIGQLRVTGNSFVSLGSSGVKTLTWNGLDGDDLVVGPGATLVIGGSAGSLELTLPTGATGRVDGTLSLSQGNSRVFAADSGALRFGSGARFYMAAAETGSPFGSGLGASGLGSVVFESGSTLENVSGSDPFGASAPNSVVRLEHGSRYLYRARTAGLSVTGRTFGDFELVAGTLVTVTAAQPASMDSVIAGLGTLQLSCAAPLTIRGDVRVKRGAALTFGTNAYATFVRFGGDAPQRLSYDGSLNAISRATLTLDNPAGLTLGGDLAWLGTIAFSRGVLHGGGALLDLGTAASFTGASATTGWFDGRVRRSIASGASTQVFPLGTATAYAPLRLAFTQATMSFPLTLSCADGEAPGLYDAPVDTAHALNRHWQLACDAPPPTLRYDATMVFAPGDLDPGTTSADLTPYQFGDVWYTRTTGTPTDSSVTARNCDSFGTLTAAKSWIREYTVTTVASGAGVVLRDPDRATYAYGSNVTLTAVGTPPATFSAWTGDTFSTLNPITLRVTRDRALTARFVVPRAYVWSGGASGAWTDSLRWTPHRAAPAVNDVLVFSGGGDVAVTGVTDESLARLVVANGTRVTLEAGGAATIACADPAEASLQIEPASSLTLTGGAPITFALPAHATGRIGGALAFEGGAHRLVARDTAAVQFATGGVCDVRAGVSGSVFGGGTGASGMRSVYFQAGSRLVQSAGGDVFGAAAPASVVAFLPGSRFVLASGAAGFTLSGRTYADFEVDAPVYSASAVLQSDVTMDTLVVRRGSLQITQNASIVLRGDLSVLPAGAMSLIGYPATATFVLRGTGRQHLGVHGTWQITGTPPLVVANPAGVSLGSDLTWIGQLQFQRGVVHTGPHTLFLATSTASVGAGEATGWVDGRLRRVIPPAAAAVFDVGDSAHFAPLLLHDPGSPDWTQLTVSTTGGLHPAFGTTDALPEKSLRRWWRLSDPSQPVRANLSYQATMTWASGDLDSTVTPGELSPMLYAGAWYLPEPMVATPTTFGATRLNVFGDLTAGTFGSRPPASVYHWYASTTSASFDDAASWSPARVLHRTDDVLVFDRGDSAVVTNVPAQAIGQLRVSNGSRVTFTSATGATLSFTGGDGDDFTVASGSTLRLAGANAIQLALGAFANARVSGTLELREGAHRVLAESPDGVVFESGADGVLGTGFTGNPFGTGVTGSSLGSVRFASGSVLRQSAGGDPFGTQVLDNVVVFDHGSRYRVESNGFTPYLSRRTFADFEVAVPSGLVDVAPTQAFTLDSLIVRQGVLNLTPSGGCTLRGDILVYRLATLNLAPRLGPSSVRLAGDSLQRLIGPGTFATGPYPTMLVDNSHGFTLERDMSWRGSVTFLRGLVRTGTHTLTLDTAAVVTASTSTGWVSGKVRRTVRGGNSSAIFDVGSETAYAPVTVTVQNNASDFALTVSTENGDHPDLAASGGDPAHSVNRWWTLLAAGTPSFTAGTAAFTFDPADLDANTAAGSLLPLRRAAGWSQPAVGARTATSVQATGLTAFGEFALAASASGAARAALAPTADDAPVTAFALGAPSPNPSRGTARVTFALPRESRVRVSVLDVQGREVATLADGTFAAGRHGVTLAAADRALSPGLYFVRMRESGGPEFTRRIAVAR